MTIILNGRPVEVPDGATAETVVELHGPPQGKGACAVEVNRRLAPRAKRAEVKLRAGDVVEIVTLVGGG